MAQKVGIGSPSKSTVPPKVPPMRIDDNLRDDDAAAVAPEALLLFWPLLLLLLLKKGECDENTSDSDSTEASRYRRRLAGGGSPKRLFSEATEAAKPDGVVADGNDAAAEAAAAAAISISIGEDAADALLSIRPIPGEHDSERFVPAGTYDRGEATSIVVSFCLALCREMNDLAERVCSSRGPDGGCAKSRGSVEYRRFVRKPCVRKTFRRHRT
jgi:hypothetical protein